MDHGEIHPRGDRAVRAFRMPPAGSGNVAPPLQRIVEHHGGVGRGEDHRAGHQQGRIGSGEILRARLALRDRHVARGADELLELLVGHFRDIHPKAIDIGPMAWFAVGEAAGESRANGFARTQLAPQFRHGAFRRPAHPELAGRNPRHAFGIGVPRRVARRRSRGGFRGLVPTVTARKQQGGGNGQGDLTQRTRKDGRLHQGDRLGGWATHSSDTTRPFYGRIKGAVPSIGKFRLRQAASRRPSSRGVPSTWEPFR